MALSTLASKLDPNSPDYDPTAAVPSTSSTPTLGAAPSTTANPLTDPMGAAKALTDANKVTATTGTFDETKGVAGRVNSLISADNPLMQTARTQAAQTAAQRGLVNSSLGVQAGQQAVINTATPIANADAALFQQQGLANQAAQNAASTTNANLGVSAGMQGMGLAQQASQFATTSNQTQQQIDAQKTQFAQNLALQSKQLDAQLEQFAQTFGLSVQDLQLKRETLSAQQQQQLDQLNLQKTQLAQQQTQFTASQAQQAGQFSLQQQQQLVMQNLDQANKVKIAEIEAAFKNQIQGSTNVTAAWQTMMQGIQAIQNNQALDPAAKTTLIGNTTDGFASFANFWTKTSNVDVSDLLAYNVATAGSAPAQPGTPAPGSTNGAGGPTGYTDPYYGGGYYGGGPSTCFPAGSMVLMGDGTERAIERVKVGDKVMGPDGPIKVREMDTPRLGARRMLGFADGHKWSEEHAHWTRHKGSQFWWTANLRMWLDEVFSGAIAGLGNNGAMRTGDEVDEFAHVDGWKAGHVMQMVGYGPDTQLYMPRCGGAPIIVDGYLVGAGIDSRGYDYTRLDWHGLAVTA